MQKNVNAAENVHRKNTWVKAIHPEQHQLTLEKDGQESSQDYSKLVLAVGANQYAWPLLVMRATIFIW